MISVRSRSRGRIPARRISWMWLALGISLGCSDAPVPPPEFHPPQPPILVIAVDGLEWDVLLPLVREGELPAIKRMILHGSYGLLESQDPAVSPITWTSVATGKSAEKHGISGFPEKSGGGKKAGGSKDEGPLDRRTKAIWNIASDFDRRVGVIGWPVTYPAEPINGVMLSRKKSPAHWPRKGMKPWTGPVSAGIEGQVYPVEREAEIFQQSDEVHDLLDDKISRIFRRFATPLNAEMKRSWQTNLLPTRTDVGYFNLGYRLFTESPRNDLFMIHFAGLDVLTHQYWRYLEPNEFFTDHNIQDIQNFENVIGDYYRYLDRAIKLMLNRAGRHRVFLISGYGMHPVRSNDMRGLQRSRGIANHRDAPAGVIIASGQSIANMSMTKKKIVELKRSELESLGSIVDITPTVLALMGLPVGEDMDGNVIRRIINPKFLKAFPILKRPTLEVPETTH